MNLCSGFKCIASTKVSIYPVLWFWRLCFQIFETWGGRYENLGVSSSFRTMSQPRHPAIKRLSHNSKSQQKEARTIRYIEKQASDFAKYLIMGQPLNCRASAGWRSCDWMSRGQMWGWAGVCLPASAGVWLSLSTFAKVWPKERSQIRSTIFKFAYMISGNPFAGYSLVYKSFSKLSPWSEYGLALWVESACHQYFLEPSQYALAPGQGETPEVRNAL